MVVVLASLFIKPKDPAKSEVWQRRHWKLSATVTVVVIVLVVISGFYGVRYSEHRAARLLAASTASAPKLAMTAAPSTATVILAKSIAVLPFENLSDDKKNEYLVAGMQDLILTKLADIGDLRVIARTSTMQYQSHPEDLKTIGQQLGVATILEGSVQKAGNQVLINVQLIDTRSDAHIWAQSYQRTLDNVFGVEGEVAEQIATALQAKLSPAQSAALAAIPTQNRAAYDLFLRAEYQTNQGDLNYDTASWKAAIPLYRQAIAKDPDFALAYARLSYAESELAWFRGGGLDVKQLNQQARADAERALQLQPNPSAAHLALGFSDYWGRGDYRAALQAFAAALALKPNDAETLAAQAAVERRQGRFDAAITSFRQALSFDPHNSALTFELGETYMMTSRYAEAEDFLQRALALDPASVLAKLKLSLVILLSRGDIPAALVAAAGDAPSLRLWRVDLLSLQRNYRAALALLDGVPDTPDNFSILVGPKELHQADLYRLLGESAQARALYAKALPQARALLATAGGVAIREASVWNSIADAELGLGHTATALAALAKSQALVGQAHDQVNGPGQMAANATLYAQAGRADIAVPLLAKRRSPAPASAVFTRPCCCGSIRRGIRSAMIRNFRRY
ncbi:MAG: tetratricopeptide repeat protein [Gammaproteobacteria bacterium]